METIYALTSTLILSIIDYHASFSTHISIKHADAELVVFLCIQWVCIKSGAGSIKQDYSCICS